MRCGSNKGKVIAPAAALHEAEDTDTTDEDSEGEEPKGANCLTKSCGERFSGRSCTNPWTNVRKGTKCCQTFNVPTEEVTDVKNYFEPLEDQEPEQETAQVPPKPLEEWAHDVRVRGESKHKKKGTVLTMKLENDTDLQKA